MDAQPARKPVASGIVKPAGIIKPADQYVLSWGEMVEEGCQLLNTTLTLPNTGKAIFSSQVKIFTPPGATCTVYGIGLHDANGLELFRSPTFQLEATAPDPLENSLFILFPAYMYGYITNAVMYF